MVIKVEGNNTGLHTVTVFPCSMYLWIYGKQVTTVQENRFPDYPSISLSKQVITEQVNPPSVSHITEMVF